MYFVYIKTSQERSQLHEMKHQNKEIHEIYLKLKKKKWKCQTKKQSNKKVIEIWKYHVIWIKYKDKNME